MVVPKYFNKREPINIKCLLTQIDLVKCFETRKGENELLVLNLEFKSKNKH